MTLWDIHHFPLCLDDILLPVDIAIVIEPEQDLEVDYKNLRQHLCFACRLATAQAEKSSNRYKAHYAKRVYRSTIGVGDSVLVWNVKTRCKNKLANFW